MESTRIYHAVTVASGVGVRPDRPAGHTAPMPAADPPRTVLSDLLDPDDLDRAIAAKLVRSRRHPTLPVRILNYSTSCQVTRAWTPTTTRCRGLVVHDDNTVLARGWDKFWEPDPDSPLPTDTPVETTDKLDGSLSILVTGQPGGPFLSSRGGFANAVDP